jgi:hypothetical protein
VWFRTDDKAPDHPKFRDLTGNQISTWWVMGSWCSEYETDGRISQRTATQIAERFEPAPDLFGTGEHPNLARLCVPPPGYETGLLERTDSGYVLHDFLDYNPSKRELEMERRRKRIARRKAEAERRKAHRVRTSADRTARRTSGERPAPVQITRDAVPTRPDPTRVVTTNTSVADASVKQVVELYRSLPGIEATAKDGGVLAAQVRQHGAETVMGFLRVNGAMIGAAHYPLQYVVKGLQGEAARKVEGKIPPPPERPPLTDEERAAAEVARAKVREEWHARVQRLSSHMTMS